MTRKKSFTRMMLIALAIVFVWRGVWGLMDLYVFPNNILVSYIVSLAIGMMILFTTKGFDDL